MQQVPITILNEITRLPGNHKCCDCLSLDITWGSISHGTLICLDCAGKHRSLGVRTSFVNSIYMDHWTKENIEMLRQGGNQKMKDYFKNMSIEETSIVEMYQSEAASHYRERLRERVRHLLSQSPYSKTSIPNSLNEFRRMNSGEGITKKKKREFRSVVFREQVLGLRLSKLANDTTVVSKVHPGGYADRRGVEVGDSVWGVGDQIHDGYDEILLTISQSSRPLTIYFYREADMPEGGNGEEDEEGEIEVDPTAIILGADESITNESESSTTIEGSSEGESDSADDSDEGSVVLNMTALLDECAEPSTRNVLEHSDQDVPEHKPINFDYRLQFTEGPLGITITQDHVGRSEITSITPHGYAAKHGVKLHDFVVGIEDQWFMNYQEAMRLLPQQSFPLTVVFRRVARNRISL